MAELDKRAYREEAIRSRADIPHEERKLRSQELCKNLKKLLSEIRKESGKDKLIVASYSHMTSEVNLNYLAKQADEKHYAFAMPCIDFKFRMHFYLCPHKALIDRKLRFLLTPAEEFHIDTADFQEELQSQGAHEIDPEEIDVMFVPMLGFDKSGTRLGYGGGCYDRYIPKLRKDAIIIGVAYKEQEFDELPCDEHDVKIEKVITA